MLILATILATSRYGQTVTGIPYWIVKNSWGVGFGLNGFFHLYRGGIGADCGMSQDVSYPTGVMATPPPSPPPGPPPPGPPPPGKFVIKTFQLFI